MTIQLVRTMQAKVADLGTVSIKGMKEVASLLEHDGEIGTSDADGVSVFVFL